jgi:hypothetical protein
LFGNNYGGSRGSTFRKGKTSGVPEQLIIKFHEKPPSRQEKLSIRENSVKSAKKTGTTFKDIKIKLTFLLISLISLIFLNSFA